VSHFGFYLLLTNVPMKIQSPLLENFASLCPVYLIKVSFFFITSLQMLNPNKLQQDITYCITSVHLNLKNKNNKAIFRFGFGFKLDKR
jgi:hypothetical protein